MVDSTKLYENVEKRNKEYLKMFEKELKESGLSRKTINKHLDNIDLFLNDYLINYMEDAEIDSCLLAVNDFLGYFLISKCMWTSKTSLKETATSIKKFYSCMLRNNLIKEEYYSSLCDLIKRNLDTYLERLDRFDNIDDYPDEWY